MCGVSLDVGIEGRVHRQSAVRERRHRQVVMRADLRLPPGKFSLLPTVRFPLLHKGAELPFVPAVVTAAHLRLLRQHILVDLVLWRTPQRIDSDDLGLLPAWSPQVILEVAQLPMPNLCDECNPYTHTTNMCAFTTSRNSTVRSWLQPKLCNTHRGDKNSETMLTCQGFLPGRLSGTGYPWYLSFGMAATTLSMTCSTCMCQEN